MSGKPEQSLFLTLDGMRGIGAVMVVMGHCLIFWGELPMAVQLLPYLVDLFFLFSGFVIAYAFEPRIAAGMSAGTFMLQRLVRLYPIYLVGIAMGLGLYAVAHIGDGVDAATIAVETLPQLVMLPSLNLERQEVFTLNGPAWSLFFELWANALYILIWRFLSLRVLIGVVLAFAATLAAASFYYGDMHAGWDWHHFLGGFPRAGFGFFCGVLLYRLANRPAAPPRETSPWAWLALLSPIPLGIVAVPEQFKVVAQLGVAFIYGPAMIWLASRVQPPRFLRHVCMRAGAISYALYMLHYPIFLALERMAWRKPELTTAYGPIIGIALLAVAISLAWFIERRYDEPVRRWILRSLRLRAASRAAARARTQPSNAAAVLTFAE